MAYVAGRQMGWANVEDGTARGYSQGYAMGKSMPFGWGSFSGVVNTIMSWRGGQAGKDQTKKIDVGDTKSTSMDLKDSSGMSGNDYMKEMEDNERRVNYASRSDDFGAVQNQQVSRYQQDNVTTDSAVEFGNIKPSVR